MKALEGQILKNIMLVIIVNYDLSQNYDLALVINNLIYNYDIT